MKARLLPLLMAAAGTAAAAIPTVIHPDADLVALYDEAWREAKTRTWEAPAGAPVRRYMDEGVYADQIWIWDSCYMAQFTKYAAADYPGIETLEALYAPVVDGKDTSLRVHIWDNPPLFAWCELEHWRFHGDRARLEEILLKRRLLQRHYAAFMAPPTGKTPPGAANPVLLRPAKAANGAWGFTWHGGRSGMDNTPRGHGVGWDKILWVDAIAQQALAAKCIAELYDALGPDHAAEARRWRAEHARLAKEINDHYWCEEDGFYYDVRLADGAFCKVRTPASLWPLLAGVATQAQADRVAKWFEDPMEFGGERPIPTVSRRSPGYDAKTGDYWRGAIWLPTSYLAIRALDAYGHRALADSLAKRTLALQSRVFKNVEPHTIWECYAPEADAPSTEHGRRVRQTFCGWSALGPINLFIENHIGLRACDAPSGTVVWDPPADAAYPLGVRGLVFGGRTLSIEDDGRTLTVTADKPLTVIDRGVRRDLPAGVTRVRRP